jgi:hypothetical protein
MPGPALIGEKLVIVGGGARKTNPPRVGEPPGVVTWTFPDKLPAATMAVIVVLLTTKKLVAATPPKLTAVAPVKFVPVIVTIAVAAALVGKKLVMVGARKVKLANGVEVPPGVATRIFPALPTPPTFAVIVVGLITMTPVAVTVPTVTMAGATKFVPVIVIRSPATPLVGVMLVMVGVGTKVKPTREAVPDGVVILTLPLTPPVATTAVIWVADTGAKLAAAVPPKLAAVGPPRFVPLIVIVAPGPAVVGEKLVIVGGAR